MSPLRKLSVSLAIRLARAQTGHPWTFLASAALVTLCMAFLAGTLRLDSSVEAMLPTQLPELRQMNEVQQRTGGARQLVVAMSGPSEEQRLRFGRRLLPRLRALDGVRDAELELPVDFLEQRALWLVEREQLEELVRASETAEKALTTGQSEETEIVDALAFQFRGLLEERPEMLPAGGVLRSRDGRYTFLLVTTSVPIADIAVGRRLLANIHREIGALNDDGAAVETRLAGLLPIYQEQYHRTRRDLALASIVALVLGILAVTALTRSAFAPLFIALSLLSGIAWTFGITRLVQPEINMITGFLIAVLIGLGVDHGVHLFMRFKEERFSTSNKLELLTRVLEGTLPAAMTSALTTAAAFFCFLAADFPGFYEFGWVAGLGVIATLVSTVLILPPMLIVTGWTDRHPVPHQPCLGRHSGYFTINPRHVAVASVVVVTVTVLAAGGASSALHLEFRNDFRELRGSSSATEFTDYVTSELGASLAPAVILVEERSEARRAVERTRSHDAVGRVIAATDMVPSDVAQRRVLLERLNQALRSPALQGAVSRRGGAYSDGLEQLVVMTNIPAWSERDLPRSLRRRFETLDGRSTVLLLTPRHSIDSDIAKLEWEQSLGEISAALSHDGIRHSLADELLALGWVTRLVRADFYRILPLVLVVLVVILLLDCWSLRGVIQIIFPLTSGMLVTFLAIDSLGMELNLFNMIVIPCLLGLGVDALIHLFHRIQKEGPGSLPRVMATTGLAVITSSLTTLIGFGSSVVCHISGLQDLGILAIVGISIMLLTTLLLFPCLTIISDHYIHSLRSGNRINFIKNIKHLWAVLATSSLK